MYTDRRFTQTQSTYAPDDLETMSEARKYHAHVYGLLRPFVGKRVLEVGAGIGTMTADLLTMADRVVAIEPNETSALRARTALGPNPKLDLRVCHLEECDAAALAAEHFDTVVCVNVLEHIEDDVAALRNFRDIVAPSKGHVLIFVPAVQSVYGPLDAELGHHRRYWKRSLRAAFEHAGMDLVRLQYSNPIGLIGWAYNSWIAKSTAHSSNQIWWFETFVAPWALPLERMLPVPLGLSLVAVGRASQGFGVNRVL
jgi:2-polyprenyl-3-methyl-5-hydroxy-6-metoxy-1,4-benzoquinol methylase